MPRFSLHTLPCVLSHPIFHAAILVTFVIILGLTGGTPFYHPDFIVERSLRTLAQGGNPKFFNYPSLMLYLNGFTYHLWFWLLARFDVIPSALEPLQVYQQSLLPNSPLPLPIFVPGHLITLFFSLGGVLATWWSAFHLTGSRWASLAAGLLLSTAFLWVQDSHFITVDTPLSALGILTVMVLVITLKPGSTLRISQVLAIGILAGLTASAKYNGALVLTTIAAAMFINYPDRKNWMRHITGLGSISLAVFLLTSPFVVFDFPKFQKDFLYEMEHARIGHFGFTTEQAGWFHLQSSLYDSFGLLALVAAFGGIIWLVASPRFHPAHKLALLVYPSLTFWVISGSRLAFQRYTLPLHPFLALYAALGLFGLYHLLAGKVWMRRFHLHKIIPLLLLFAMLTPNLRNDVQHIHLLTRQDTRILFTQMLQISSIDQPSQRIFAGMYGLPHIYKARKGSDQNAFSNAAIIILDSFSHDRHLFDSSSPLRFPRSNLSGGWVIQISPYSLAKDQIPLASQSIYSPYLPDLWLRERPGPYFEIYLKQSSLADQLLWVCKSAGGNCTQQPSEAGFYYQTIMK